MLERFLFFPHLRHLLFPVLLILVILIGCEVVAHCVFF
ncbi:unnamed protein product [Nyctereutes procyonoides]|uniref:(raccoon dog) hypothetical protein n=1 Tax=Nyctereutes procyonoides TaxID=34880 RepID=A0A811Y8U2_NYCPR|nr:unnamed protein product [Nyctereutes procyonoides]